MRNSAHPRWSSVLNPKGGEASLLTSTCVNGWAVQNARYVHLLWVIDNKSRVVGKGDVEGMCMCVWGRWGVEKRRGKSAVWEMEGRRRSVREDSWVELETTYWSTCWVRGCACRSIRPDSREDTPRTASSSPSAKTGRVWVGSLHSRCPWSTPSSLYRWGTLHS